MNKRGIKTGIVLGAVCLLFSLSMSAVAMGHRDTAGRIAELEADIKILEYEKNGDMAAVLEAETDSLEEQLAIARQDLQRAQEEGDSSGALRAELAISNSERTLAEKKEKLADCLVQMQLDAYYADNRDRLAEEAEAHSGYECCSSRISIEKCRARLAYLEVRQKELDKKLEIEKKRLELGYATALEVSMIQSQADENLLMRQEAEEEIAYHTDVLTLYGEENTAVELPDTLQELTEDYVNRFYTGNLQLLYYEQQANAYGSYIDNASQSGEASEEMSLLMELARLNGEQYRVELQKYVRQRELSYSQYRLKAQEYDLKLAVTEQQLANSNLLYENGKLREVDVMELETEKARLEYERKCCICDAWLELYLLEHGIVIK